MNVLTIAFAMWVAMLFFSSWLKPATKRRIVGMGLMADITVHTVLQLMFGGDAAGRAGLLLAGVMINVTMHMYRKYAGWEKLGMDGWTRFDGRGKVLSRPTPTDDQVSM